MTIADGHTIAVTQAPGSALPDGILIRRIAEQDHAALQLLIRRYQTRVHRFIWRIVGDRELAEDIASETFFAIWQKARSFEGRSSVSTWLLAIARHKALKARARPSTSACPLDEVEAILVDPGESPEEAIAREEFVVFLHGCLIALPAEQGRLVQLVYYQGKSVKHAASIVGIPENTAKSRIHLARKKLAVAFGKDGHPGEAGQPIGRSRMPSIRSQSTQTIGQRNRLRAKSAHAGL